MSNKLKSNKPVYQWLPFLAQVLVPLAFGFYSILLGQDTHWDIENYHLYNPYAFLHGRFNFDLQPAGWATCFNPYLDVVYFQAIRFAAPWVVGFMLGVVQGLNYVLLVHICRHCLKSINVKYAGWAMILGLAGVLSAGFLSEIGTVFWDNVVSLFILASLLIVVASISPIVSGKRNVLLPIALAGLMAGLGAGLKLTVVLNAVSLFTAFFFIPIPWKMRFNYAAFFGGGLALGFVPTEGVWAWNIWHQLGNPIFPWMNNIFHGQLAPSIPIHDLRFHPKDLLEKVLYPFIFTVDPLYVGEVACKQVSWTILYLVGIFFLLKRAVLYLYKTEVNPFRPEVKYLLSFFGVSYLLWLNVFGYYRYQMSIEVLVPLVLFVLLLNMFEFNSLVATTVAIMLVYATVFNLQGVGDWGHSRWGKKVYRVERPWLPQEKIDSVILVGLPLSWIIPALDIKAPCIQLMPNFPVNEAYFQRARSMLKDSRGGKTLVAFQPWVIRPKGVIILLKKYGFIIHKDGCVYEIGDIGTKRIPFVLCSAQRISNDIK